MYGIPHDVTTQSGKPLADDFGKLIVSTIIFRGIDANQQEVPFSWTREEFKKKVSEKEPGTEIYYIEMFEWKTETHFQPALHYNLHLSVFNEQGMETAANQEKGFFYFDKNIAGKENLATSTTNILERLFTDKKSPQTTALINSIEATKTVGSDISSAMPSDLSNQPPSNIKKEIKAKCASDFPFDYASQASCVKIQEAGWMEMNK